jgi:hypothetical protein|tara:strand:- start:518 stop:766 length:249 start_codon:yes stop_codon:yes gene_type:complete
MITNSPSALNFPIIKTIDKKKLIGRINSKNSGILKKTMEKTTAGSISPLEACSKYWIDLDETIIRIKITLMVAVYEKIAFRK